MTQQTRLDGTNSSRQFCPACNSNKVTLHKTIKSEKFNINFYECDLCKKEFQTMQEVIVKETEVLLANSLKQKKKVYSQNWEAYNQAQTREKEMFLKILTELLAKIEINYAKRSGRPNTNVKEMITISALKIYDGKSSRRSISEINLLQGNLQVSSVPHFNTILRFLSQSDLTPILKQLITLSAIPLKQIETDFAIDSSGFSTSIYSRWFDHKWGEEKEKREWKKAHLISGVKTNVITGVEITQGSSADIIQYEPLMETTAKNFEMKEISADRTYISKRVLNITDKKGIVPFIPFKQRARRDAIYATNTPEIWKKMYDYFHENQAEFMKHYHKRSNAETVFQMLKSKFGNYLRTKGETSQANEILLKVLCHNICVLIQEIHENNIELN